MENFIEIEENIYPISILSHAIPLHMKTYIVSIYRQDQENPDALAGIAEEAGSGEKRAFNSFDGLRQILNSAGKAGNQRAGSGARSRRARCT